MFSLKIALIRAKIGPKIMLFARMPACFALKRWFHSGENGVKYDSFRPNDGIYMPRMPTTIGSNPALESGMMLSAGWKKCLQ